MPPLSSCRHGSPHTGLGVDDRWLADDEAIFDQLAHVLSGIGIANFGGLIGIQPDLALATLQHSCR